MASRDDLKIAIDADIKNFEAGVGRAAKITDQYEVSLRRASSAAAQLEKSLNDELTKKVNERNKAFATAGDVMLKSGLVMAAGLGYSAKAAIDWESSWAGVAKVTDGNAKQMGVLQDQLRGLTRILPASHAEIAGVAEAAGQLGVARQDVAAFTKVAIDLGNTTNLSAEEAATSLARLSNIMGLSAADTSRLGSSLVALGNNGASTEGEILDMGLRIAAAGKLIGLSSGDVLGYSNALSSLGVEAEAGGTAVSQTFAAIDKAVSSGGSTLEGFAQLAGMSVADFRTTWGTDAPAALQAFLNGLQKVNTGGGDVYGTLEKLKISGVRQTDTLLRLAQSGDLLSDSLKTGNDAYEKNNALVAEAAKRYDTTESKAKIAYNTFKDGAIDIGNTLLPALASLATGLSDVFGFFADLPQPVKGVLAVLGSVGAVALVAGGAFLTLGPKVLDAVDAFSELKNVSPGAAGGVGKVATALGVLGAAYAAVAASGQVFGKSQDPAGVGKYTGAILDLANGADGAGKKVDALFQVEGRGNAFAGAITAKDSIDGLREAIDAVDPNVLDSFNDKKNELLGYDSRGGDARELIEQYDAALTSLVQSGAADQAAEGAKYFAEQAREAGLKTGEIKDLLPGYNGALADTANQSKITGDATADTADQQQVATEAWQAGADAAGELGEETKTLKEQLDDLNGSYLDRRAANRQWQESLDAARKSLEENGKTLDINTEKGRKNAAALDDVAKAGADRLSSAAADGASQERLNKIYEVQRERLIDTAKGYGMGSEAAKRYADDALAVPTEISTEVKADTKAATEKIKDVDSQKVANKQFRIDAKTEAAKREVRGLAGIVDAAISAINPTVDITLSPKAQKLRSEANRTRGQAVYARGGEVPMWAGEPGKDSVDALLMPGEHVFTTAEVNAMGGQGAVYQFRRDLRTGASKTKGDVGFPGKHAMGVQHFADGGAVAVPFKVDMEGLSAAVQSVTADYDAMAADISAELSRVAEKLFSVLGGGVGGLTPEQVIRGQNFAKSQVGKPYVWGGVGPGGYDCSGFVSAVLNAALGMNPYSRRGATGSMPWSGFRAGGGGAFDVGWFTGNPGHTAARIGNLNVESYGGHGPAVGKGARGPGDGLFNRRMSYAGKRDTGGMFPDGSFVANTAGRPEWVLDPDQTQHFAAGGAVTKSANLTMRPVRGATGGFSLGPGYDTTQGIVNSRAIAPDVAPSLRAVSTALTSMRREAKEVTAAERALARERAQATAAGKTVTATEKQLKKLRDAEKPDKKEIARLEGVLKTQRAAAKKATTEADSAEKNLTTQRDQLSTATTAWKDAQQALIDSTREKAEDLFGTLRETAERIVSQGAAFGGSGASVTAEGLLLKKTRAAATGEEYNGLLQTLGKKGLDRSYLDEILAEGSTDEALALARSLSTANAATIRSLNDQQARLSRAGAQVGLTAVRGSSTGTIQVAGAAGGGVTINFNGPISTTDIGQLAKALQQEQGRALIIARGTGR